MKREEIRQQVFDKYSGHCAYCGRAIDIKDMQIDHINPLWRGHYDSHPNQGNNDLINLNPSCRRCNFRKSTMTIEQFRAELKEQCKRIMERNFQVKQSMDYNLLEYHDKPIVFYFEKGCKK